MSDQPGQVPSPAEVADRLAITEVLAWHSRGLDRLDAAALKACYWPEAEVDYGSYKGGAHVFADLVVGALGEGYALTRHGLGNPIIELHGTDARVETCVSAGHLFPGAEQDMHFYGRYLDRLEKRGAQWKILHRQVVMDWNKLLPVDDQRDSDAFKDLAKGGHHPADPLYAFLAAS
ncbi:MAG: nuclear transport factor 2 family protein [Halioglobus sp.]|nr:nuclear transport factor 2 family protein [Halioglobus sp.]